MSTENQNSNSQPQPSKAEKEAAAKIKEAEETKAKYEQKLKDLEEKEEADKAKAEKEAADKAEEERIAAEKKDLDAKAAAESAKPLKLKHNDEKYEFSASEKSNYIVRHSKMVKLPSNQEIEDPGSVRIQIYRPEVYADLILENEKTGKRNAFVQGGEKTIVLHDPTK